LLGEKQKSEENPEQQEVKEAKEPTEFDEFFRGEPEVYEALKDLIFLNPKKLKISIKDAEDKAKELKKAKDNLRAAGWYRIAGSLAIYEGNVSKVKDYFSKYGKLMGKNPRILENPELAVKRAQDYYKASLGKE